MKARSGFVSNSSSASFILDKRYITPDDIQKIKEYCQNVGEGDNQCWDSWSIDEDNDFVRGFTIMDNGYLLEWIKKNLNLPLNAIASWEGD